MRRAITDKNFKQPILVKDGTLKEKPLSVYSFRNLHRTLLHFYDYELQKECCKLAGVESVGDNLSIGYCCVDEQLGLQFYILGACNRDGRLDWWVPIPDEKEIVFSYQEVKDKLVTIEITCIGAIKPCLSRCRELMEKHEKNHTIMWEELDKFRDTEFPLDIWITVPVDEISKETVRFRPIMRDDHGLIHGYLVEEPKQNNELHKGDAIEVRLIRKKYERVVEATQYIPCSWKPVKNGESVGEFGSEGGLILADEEYDYRCRITLEKCDNTFAITCGIYGYMVHTVFCKAENAQALYEEIRAELQAICDTYNPEVGEDEEDFLDEIAAFVERN